MKAVETIGKYEIVAKLGEGGMGVVYKGYDATLQRHVAIKVLAAHLASDESIQRRFLTEARAAASLNHRNIVTVYDAGQDADRFYFAMELIEGDDLDDRLRKNGPIDVPTAVNLLSQIASALDEAHKHGLIHRDVKPANILLHAGVPKVADFGIARVVGSVKQTQTGAFFGTLAYTAPEIWDGKQANEASDQYAFAIMAYQMLTGKLPFEITSFADGLKKHCQEKPDLSIVNQRLRPDLARALAKNPLARFSSCTEFVQALKVAEPPKSSSRRILVFALIGVVAATGIALIYLATRGPVVDVTAIQSRAAASYASVNNFKGSPDQLPAYVDKHGREFSDLLNYGAELQKHGVTNRDRAGGFYYIGVVHLYRAFSDYIQRDFARTDEEVASAEDNLEKCRQLGDKAQRITSSQWAKQALETFDARPDFLKLDASCRNRLIALRDEGDQ